MVKPLSKRAQLLSPSIQIRAMFLGLLQQLSGLGLRKGTLLRCLQALGALSRDASWATTGFWGAQPPFFAIPLLHFNSLFQWLYWDPLDSLLYSCQEYHIQNNFNFSSDTARPQWQNGQYIWLIPPIPLWVLFIWRLSLFFLFWLYNWVLFSSNAFQYGKLGSEGMTALQLKQIPQCLWLGNIQSSSCGGLQEQGISGFSPSFQFPGCKEQVGVASRVFAIRPAWANIQGSGPHRNNLISSPLHVPVESFPGTPTGVSEPVANKSTWTQPHSPQNLACGNKAPY